MTVSQKIPIIELKNIDYRRDATQILDNINWQIHPGEHWALVGLNGSGKSTIIRILSGYDFPSSGTVQVLGEEFGKTSLPSLRQRIGFVSAWLSQQLPAHYNVLNTIISGKFASFGIYQPITAADRQQAYTLLEQFGLADFANRQMVTLSQGESQTVLILRALMTEPELLILDEPSTGLDLFAREHLLRFLEELALQKPAVSQLLITHHTEEITPVYQHICLLKAGQIFRQGLTADLLTADVLQDFYGQPIQILPFAGSRIQVIPADNA